MKGSETGWSMLREMAQAESEVGEGATLPKVITSFHKQCVSQDW